MWLLFCGYKKKEKVLFIIVCLECQLSLSLCHFHCWQYIILCSRTSEHNHFLPFFTYHGDMMYISTWTRQFSSHSLSVIAQTFEDRSIWLIFTGHTIIYFVYNWQIIWKLFCIKFANKQNKHTEVALNIIFLRMLCKKETFRHFSESRHYRQQIDQIRPREKRTLQNFAIGICEARVRISSQPEFFQVSFLQ